MRSMILTGCLFLLCIAGNTQSTNGRPRSGTPLRFSMNGSTEILEGDLIQYSTKDTGTANKLKRNFPTAVGGNPSATRFSSLRAQCDPNAMTLQWVAVQQSGADKYEIEQSADEGRNWTVLGVVPANRTDPNEASYSFTYNKNISDVLIRVTATNIAGERVHSSMLESPCRNTSYLAVTPNPILSTGTVRIGSPAAARVKLVLTNNMGVVVQTRDAGLLQGNNQLPLDMSNLGKGYYTLTIQWSGGKQDMLKIVKE